MKTLVLTDPREFLERAKPLLVDEARNNLVLGIARGMITTQARTKEAAFYVVERDGHPAAAAFITPPFNLFVSGVTDVEAIRDLARTVHGDRVTIPGVSGDRSSVEVFRDA